MNIGFAKYIRYEIDGKSVFVLCDSQATEHKLIAEKIRKAVPVSAGLIGIEHDYIATNGGSMTLDLPEKKQDGLFFKDMLSTSP